MTRTLQIATATATGETAFVPENAVAGALLLLGAGLLVGTAFASGLFARRIGRLDLSRWSFRAAAAAALLYAAALGVAAAASRDRMLPPGGAKVFCEVDCHLSLSLLEADRVAALGSRRARGEFLVLRLRTWFDPRTITPRRGNRPLSANPRRVLLRDSEGRSYPRSPEAEAALGDTRANPPLSAPVRPGESFDTRLVFEVPSAARGLRLLVASADLPTRLLVGHESSPGHGKVYFEVP